MDYFRQLGTMPVNEIHTDAGQIEVIAISDRPSLSKSIARPLVKTLIPTFPKMKSATVQWSYNCLKFIPIAYAVLPRKKRE
jgi:hypothetical protein